MADIRLQAIYREDDPAVHFGDRLQAVRLGPSAVPRKVLGNVVYSLVCENLSISVP
jgi:hypothetical protein